MSNGFRIKTTQPAEPKAVYKAWLSGREHSAMTGAAATASGKRGGRFTAWDGYIRGRNLELKPHWCIVQSWRTTKFSEGDPDSRLELCIHTKGEGSEVLLIHTEIPPGQASGYRSGWVKHYFEPMRRYFTAKKSSRKASIKKTGTKPAQRKPVKQKTAKLRPTRR
jgi:activator of HSP90 ATPase